MKKLFILLASCLMLAACGNTQDNTKPLDTAIIYNIKEYNEFVFYYAGSQIDRWYDGNSGTITRMLKYHTELTLTDYGNKYIIDGKFIDEYKHYNYTYTYVGNDYSFRLYNGGM